MTNPIGPVSDIDAATDGLNEDAAAGSTVGIQATATDPDGGDTVTGYAVSDSRFTVDPDGTVRVASGASFDAETEADIALTVTATSSDTSTSHETFYLSVADVNEAPVMGIVQGTGRIDRTNYSVTTDGYTVTARKIDGSGDLTAPSVGNMTASNSGLGVAGSTGAGAPVSQLGYDAGRLVSEEILIDFDAAVASATVDIEALWSNENGTYEVGQYTLFRNGAQIGTGTFASPSGHTGMVLELDPGVAFDQIVFSATPYGSQGAITNNSSDYFVKSVDYNFANGISESASTGEVAVTLSAVDPDVGDTVHYSLVDATGNPLTDTNFEIVDNEVRLKAGAALDRETSGTHDLIIRATDLDGLYDDKTVTIHVLDANEFAVSAVSDTDATGNGMDETATSGTSIGVAVSATDADATATVSYAVDDVRFTVDPDGTVRVASGASFDAETEPSITLTVTATSTDGSTSSHGFTLSVGDIDEHDVGAVVDGDANVDGLDDTAATGSAVGIRVSALDADATATVSYAVDDARFSVDPDGTVRVAAGAGCFDAETEPSIALTVTATSSDGSTSTQGFTLSVASGNEWPVSLALSKQEVTENTAAAVVGRLSVSDPNADDSHSFSVSDNRFTVLDGDLRLKAGVALDHETEAIIALDVTATDEGGLSVSQTFVLTVTDVFDYVASSSADLIVGNGAANVIYGFGGNDTIRGREGNDVLRGGDGNDDIAAGTGDDWVHGGRGSDMIRGGSGNDRLAGNDGYDMILGGSGADILWGGSGSDLLSGGAGSDELYGGRGNDTLAGGSGADILRGGKGNDFISGGEGDDNLFGGSGHDRLAGSSGADILRGGNGNDSISGGKGNDELIGGSGHDRLAGSAGADILRGGTGNDDIAGGTGNDRIYAGAGNDSSNGGENRDTIFGGSGRDFLSGGAGSDRLFGGNGADRLNGGGGNDKLTGGAGADTFIFNRLTDGEKDVIRDFQNGVDLVQLRGVTTSELDNIGAKNVFIGAEQYAQVEIDGHLLRFQGLDAASITSADFLIG